MANRTVLGEFQGDYVLRVSRPGHNVLDPNLPLKNLAFDSRWPETLQVVHSGRVSMPSTLGSLSLAHGGPIYSTGTVVFMWIEASGIFAKLDTSVGAQLGQSNFRAWTTPATIEVRRSNMGSNHPDAWFHFVTMRQSNG